jgi:hypothetical protein
MYEEVGAGIREFAVTGTLANGAFANLFCGANNSITRGIAHVSAIGPVSSSGGTVMFSAISGSSLNTKILVGGSSNFGIDNVPNKLTVYGDSTLELFNQLGYSVNYLVKITCT